MHGKVVRNGIRESAGDEDSTDRGLAGKLGD
jgi:hypothetical protein